jgi:hypothetical protein
LQDNESGVTTVVHTTQHHPFWDATGQQWVDAAELRPGNLLLTGDDGSETGVTVVDVDNFTGSRNMRDLTVADIHTYFVVAGTVSALVHNVDCGDAAKLPKDFERRATGILDIGVDEIPFVSGPAKSDPAERLGGFVDDLRYGNRPLPGMTKKNYHHVEMQAAAYMRMNKISSGTLYVDYDFTVCALCMGGHKLTPGTPMSVGPIADLLPEGALLTVVFRDRTPLIFRGNSR